MQSKQIRAGKTFSSMLAKKKVMVFAKSRTAIRQALVSDAAVLIEAYTKLDSRTLLLAFAAESLIAFWVSLVAQRIERGIVAMYFSVLSNVLGQRWRLAIDADLV